MMSEDTPVAKLNRHLDQLKRERLTWEPFWRDVQRFICPDRGRFIKSSSVTEINQGQKLDRRINSVASRALGVLASGMQSGLTSKARQWFRFNHPDPDLNRYQPVREWYDTVQDILENILHGSNAYQAFRHHYHEKGAFGTAATMALPHPERVLHCRSFTIGSYYIAMNEYNEIETFFYYEWMTARELVELYGRDKCPQEVLSAYNAKNYEDRFETVNAITKNPSRYGIRIGEQFPVASVHYLTSKSMQDTPLRVSGYSSFPVMVSRWDAIDVDSYGWAPTRDIIGDVKALQKMEEDGSKGVAKGVTPPMRIPPSLERRGLNMQPGALNPVSDMNEHAVAPLYTVGLNLDHLQNRINAYENHIYSGLYNDIFLAVLSGDNPQMTAREIAERHEEKMMMMGPVLERSQFELHDPFLDRVFLLAWEAGRIPPHPPELEGSPTKIEYLSILTQAQKAIGVNRIEQGMAFLGNLLPAFPELKHTVRPFPLFQSYASMLGMRAEVLASREEYEQAVQAEAQQIQAANSAQTGETLVKTGAQLSDVDMAKVQQLLTGTMGGLAL